MATTTTILSIAASVDFIIARQILGSLTLLVNIMIIKNVNFINDLVGMCLEVLKKIAGWRGCYSGGGHLNACVVHSILSEINLGSQN